MAWGLAAIPPANCGRNAVLETFIPLLGTGGRPNLLNQTHGGMDGTEQKTLRLVPALAVSL